MCAYADQLVVDSVRQEHVEREERPIGHPQGPGRFTSPHLEEEVISDCELTLSGGCRRADMYFHSLFSFSKSVLWLPTKHLKAGSACQPQKIHILQELSIAV